MNEAIATDGPNSDQIEFWNGDAARKWVDFNPLLDRMLEPLTVLTMARATPLPGEQVLDVGCGCGGTSLALAEAVSPGGAVTGLDISTPMLALARQRAEDASAAATFINADAQTHPLPQSEFDLLFSRFGIMFFTNPKAAFANFHGALKPGGRLAFVCWRALDLNPWVTIPYEAARPFAPEFELPKSDEPGQFAFARREWVEDILKHAGFIDVQIESHETTQHVGAGDLDACVEVILKLGPVSRLLREAEEDAVPAIRSAVREAVAPYHDGKSIALPAAVWIVGAQRP